KWWVYHLANKYHIKTRAFIIRRELLLNIGDTFSLLLAEETARNLRSLSFINNAEIELVKNGDSLNILHVKTSDYWSLTGGVFYTRNSDENTVQFQIEEKNLLGLGQFVSLNYTNRDYDHNSIRLDYWERRILGTRNSLHLFFDENPHSGSKGLYFNYPYYSHRTQTTYLFGYNSYNNRLEYYDNGDEVAQIWTKGHTYEMMGGFRWGGYYSKITTSLSILYTKIISYDTTIYNPIYSNIGFPNDSTYFQILPNVGFYNTAYFRDRHLENMGKIEDVRLVKGIGISFGPAINDKNGAHFYNRLSLSADYDLKLSKNLFFLTASRILWLKNGEYLRKHSHLSIRCYNNGIEWYTLYGRIAFDSDYRSDHTQTVYLGENTGVRGLLKNFETGESRIVINIENRFFPELRILAISFGLVQFFDIGWTGDRNREYTMEDGHLSFGVGLRFGFEKFLRSEPMRIDFAYSNETKEWLISIGLRQYLLNNKIF
ncbi:MAG: hypothetical protein ABIJ45_05195, partial [Candidatus Zixiibacteriota bacterium]